MEGEPTARGGRDGPPEAVRRIHGRLMVTGSGCAGLYNLGLAWEEEDERVGVEE